MVTTLLFENSEASARPSGSLIILPLRLGVWKGGYDVTGRMGMGVPVPTRSIENAGRQSPRRLATAIRLGGPSAATILHDVGRLQVQPSPIEVMNASDATTPVLRPYWPLC